MYTVFYLENFPLTHHAVSSYTSSNEGKLIFSCVKQKLNCRKSKEMTGSAVLERGRGRFRIPVKRAFPMRYNIQLCS